MKKRINTRISNSGATRITTIFLAEDKISLKIDEISEKGNFKHLRGERSTTEIEPSKEEIEKFIAYSMTVNKREEEARLKRDNEEKTRKERGNVFLSQKIIEGEEKDYSRIYNNLFYRLAESHSYRIIDAAVIVLYILGEIELKRVDDESYEGRDFGYKEIFFQIKDGFLCNKMENQDNTEEYFIIINGVIKFKITAKDERLKGRYSRDYVEVDYRDFEFNIVRL